MDPTSCTGELGSQGRAQLESTSSSWGSQIHVNLERLWGLEFAGKGGRRRVSEGREKWESGEGCFETEGSIQV